MNALMVVSPFCVAGWRWKRRRDRARAVASPVHVVVSDGDQVAGLGLGRVADGGIYVDLGPATSRPLRVVPTSSDQVVSRGERPGAQSWLR